VQGDLLLVRAAHDVDADAASMASSGDGLCCMKYFSLFSSTLITFLIQGALDGGLDIPHSENGFAGFSKEDKSLNAETHRKYILGGRIADYMKVQFLSFQAAMTSPSTTFR
jgi:hypothetical protein